ncbi:hypothetical protein IWQ60_005233 [Tieghemiomyces parasiticus]|uniref:BRISC and BRCA1-A complex member 1 n=1 Tax=Tieghemiomyces parasiticus TaxID=78921 RepID=A0A9W8AEY4_9FUNG|nr:hypothetical protein IWQ60_005233 [Tieghemiomyces parasiticus]
MSVTQPPSTVEETGERIVLCIDVHDEMDDVLLPAPSIDACTRMALTKRLLKMFVATKLRLATATVAGGDSKSTASGPQFALCLLKERAEWLMDFSADCDLLFAVIDELTTTGHYQDLDVRTLFMTVEQNAVRLRARSPRVICIYGRSNVVPSGITDVMVTHGTNPRLTLDLIFLHRRKSSEIDPQVKFPYLQAYF